ncbi:MAG: Gfo/Idh/MocA family oxidoreductase, partial [Planctomycetales bacterium]|nr:Gfo/Idh/MocA family oxidoreductase [Planctomycetales bacterium]
GNLKQLAMTGGHARDDVQVVALCDVNRNNLDSAAGLFPQARKYVDFRELYTFTEDIDAVVVSTTEHTHAYATMPALRAGKHVYCEKPLTHNVAEARMITQAAVEAGVATQMGTQIHAGDNYRRVVELVQSGAIGTVREVHVLSTAVYTGAKFTTGTEAPAHVDWNLWLGPAPERPYSEGVHPFTWRSFWDYGTGSLGDFGCHYMDLPHWALDLRDPTTISAEGPPVDAVSTPAWCIVKYEYPARGKRPAVKLTWYDSGKTPPQLDEIRAQQPKDQNGNPLNTGSGQLFIGDKGMLISNYGQHSLLPAEQYADFKRPEPFIPASIGHHAEWLEAIRTGGPTTCNFDYSGALTESVMLGTVAYRAGKAIEWDAANLKVTNAPEAQHLIHKEYRKGWTL